MKKIAFLFAFICITIGFKAQDVVKKDTLNGTELTISMDEKINQGLLDMEGRCSKSAKTTATNGTSTPTTTTKKKVLVPNRALTTEEVCRQNPKIQGYKIQVNVVKSNDEANKVKAYFRSKYPYIKVITDASLRPDYKILAGSYFTRESAKGDLAKVKQIFKGARVVEYNIFCAEAK